VARATGTVAVVVVVVGRMVVVVEGLDPPVYRGSVDLSSPLPQAVRLAISAAVQDRAAMVCFNVSFLHSNPDGPRARRLPRAPSDPVFAAGPPARGTAGGSSAFPSLYAG